MKAFIFLILIWGSFAVANERVGQIDCHTLDRPISYVVRADLFGTKSGIEYANIKLTSYDWNSHKETQPLRIWENVASMSDRNFSEHFKNNEIELDAFYDDVAAMSFINFEDQEHQLVCAVVIKSN